MFRYAGQGIGGLIGRDTPMCRPVRIAFTNICSVQMPRPVLRSGVRFIVYEMPQGPTNAVLVAALAHPHVPDNAGGGVSVIVSGWPESIRDMSGSGPLTPIFSGVWQSWQPVVLTMYSPRMRRVVSAVALRCPTNTEAAISAIVGMVPQMMFRRVVLLMAFSCSLGRTTRRRKADRRNGGRPARRGQAC